MKLLVVVHYPVYGGPHNRALELTASLNARGWRTTVLVPDEPGNAAERLRMGGVDVVQMRLHRARATLNPRLHVGYFLGFPMEVRAIYSMIREKKYDAVMIGGLMNPHAAIAARLAEIPLVWQIVDSRCPKLLVRPLLMLVERFADSVMFNGHALISLHGDKEGLTVPTFVYYPPVETKRRFVVSKERRRITRSKLKIPDNAVVIGTVANLSPQKGIEYFIRTAAILYKKYPNSWFIVVGGRYATKPRYNDKLEAELVKSDIPKERLIFMGGRSDVENYYSAMDIKLITSIPGSEGTTTTAIEAMACGVPVVATDVGAVHEVVDEGATGFIVPPLSPLAIAEASMKILRSSGLHAEMSRSARSRAVSRFDVEVCLNKHLEALEAAVTHCKRRSRKTKA
jgi:glycosyltransferase involved in cell wall biosynthesis